MAIEFRATDVDDEWLPLENGELFAKPQYITSIANTSTTYTMEPMPVRNKPGTDMLF